MRIRQVLIVLLTVLVTGCSPMKTDTLSQQGPTLKIEDFFQGKVYAWGIFEDRFGNLRRQFQVEIDGDWDGDRLVLNEKFLYSDGERDLRVWTITPTGDGEYEGRADDIIGTAEGISEGNRLNWRYKMELKVGDGSWKVAFDDWMYLQPGNVLVNKAEVRKWGVQLGVVTLFFIHADQLKDAPFVL
ncbi:MAG: DUF3833 domain-containing protein [Oceanospirillales bacterium]|uniref:Uncharacterized protein DUF3833 n=1 Tax=Marinobacterium halophilum TaxID=267374 RepID=A0A2P8ETP4_9GAMM|nr:DUF3833 domain-containing protein [Marinobacterium halophilum]MBR9829335.1 DUF3833 domain-containing protein [Oceanospirillales bacterium]PSL12846.1 uncharacterized protein DUF3833 [Marinobacterium halophilum]